MKIGRLEELPIRELWKHEQYDFSMWLSQEGNLSILGEELGISFTDIETEKFVGSYRCDIVATDDNSSKTVIIENQLEKSDHDHLGKIITYASGLGASIIIWIVVEARSEHKSAIEWLNRVTGKDINFFLVELKAYRIGDSLPAPKFEIAEMPNDFSKIAVTMSNNKEQNKTQASRYEFWTRLIAYSANNTNPKLTLLKNRKGNTDHWMTISIGTSKAHMEIKLNSKGHYIEISLYIPDNKELYNSLFSVKADIEATVGHRLDWRESENTKKAEIVYEILGLDFDDSSNYDRLMLETLEHLVRLKEIYVSYLKQTGYM
ncbi:DUF4268 domain-containing protein [Veillonella caviae]|uniref:DUF4268 domain-containing protein n=1 Tax=Veillonella caviae TaxID=248316 RepID=UPI002A9140C2|nr:DUF4268 domain-containing protein [Veillonella caviae]MDY5409214.1 DUF4268 domain-containing protein [Veillonella caviae]